MVQYKLIQSSEHHEIDWEALEQVVIQLAPAVELAGSNVEHDRLEQEENESALPGRTTWEAWKARKRMCAPL